MSPSAIAALTCGLEIGSLLAMAISGLSYDALKVIEHRRPVLILRVRLAAGADDAATTKLASAQPGVWM